MVVLVAQDLRRSFGVRTVLDGVSLNIDDGEHVGLVGRNGAGKTTLGRLLAGFEEPDAGTITVRGDAEVGYLPQVPRLDPSATALQVVLEGLAEWTAVKLRYDEVSAAMAEPGADLDPLLKEQTALAGAIERLGGWDIEHRAEAMLGQVGIEDPQATTATMSGGEQRRVALARLLVARPTLAILDEPTNHLDIETIEWLESVLSERDGTSLLLITHDRYLLDRVVDRTCEIEGGKLYSYDGGYGRYLQAKAEREALAARTEANRQNFLRRELEWLRRQPKARTGKQKARIDRAETVIAAGPKRQEGSVSLQVSQTARTGHTVLELEDVAVDVPGRRLVEGLTLALRKGDRLGIVGKNGAGKTSLLRVMLGQAEAAAGEVRRGKNTKIAYLDQTRSGLDDDKTVFETVAGNRTQIQLGSSSVDVRSYLQRFLFSSHAQRQRVGTLSGGERARVALAKMLADPANLLVLDEPTNDLDIETLGALESMLVEFEGTCIVVTHDRYVLDRIATAILAFEGEGRVIRYEGNYSSWAEKRPRPSTQKAEPSGPGPSSRKPDAKPAAAPTAGLSRSERKELDAIEPAIEAAEQRVTDIEATLADAATYAEGHERAQALADDLEHARVEVARLMERWEELESKRTDS